MDRVFLDANVLFSAAYRELAPLQRLWRVADVELFTSRYAVGEARTNLTLLEQRSRLDGLMRSVNLAPEPLPDLRLSAASQLPMKDRPILLGAIACKATHLLTGDFTHFGRWYGKRVLGVLVVPPGVYLARHS